MQPYTHFTLTERNCLHDLLAQGMKNAEIARYLGRDRSSIGRELRRNSNKDKTYTAWRGQSLYLMRRRKCRKKYILVKNEPLCKIVKEGLAKYWSPETIVNRLPIVHPDMKANASTIYRAIKAGIIDKVTKEQNLRRRGKRRYGNRSRFSTIHPDHTIHERPEAANNRERMGDLEGDTVLCKNGSIYTSVDRKIRFLYASKCRSQSAEDVKEAMLSALKGVNVRTLTLDNGSEFAKHREIASELNTDIYFTDPHSPWQRGSNENINDVLRFFFPRGSDLSKVSDADLQAVLDLINDRPRKCLNWLTPREVLRSICCT